METVEIRKRLSDALSLRNMKAVELSEKTGISKGSISQYMSGYVEPKSDRIYLMAKALSVNPVWLMGFDVPMEVYVEVSGESELSKMNRLSAYLGERMKEFKDSPKLQQLVEDFMMLNPAQQESVLALIHSMIPNTHQQPEQKDNQ